LVRSILRGQLFTFVWLPRDDLNTQRREAIGAMMEETVGTAITSWSVETGEGSLSLVRYTQYIDNDAPTPNSRALDDRLNQMVRGWAPAVEEALIARVGAPRATRRTISYAREFSDSYRTRTPPEEGAEDIVRLAALRDTDHRGVRLFRRDNDEPNQLRIKTYRRGGLIPLSEAVPVFENFGFRVLEEMPSQVGVNGTIGYIHDFRLELREAEIDAILARTAEIESAISSVFSREAEDDEFNRLVLVPRREAGATKAEGYFE
jgi:glutamate dehydrogenase